MPETIAPMLARLGKLPRDDDSFGYEVKWDGVRAVAHVDAGHLTLTGRNGTDFTPRYPEVRALGRRARLAADDPRRRGGRVRRARPAQLRAAAVADAPGLRLRGQRRTRDVPVTYVIFDLLWLEGHSRLALPYRDRRRCSPSST